MSESLFTSQTPATPDANDSQLYTLGTRIEIAVDGFVTAIRWFYPTVLPGTAVEGVLYDPAGPELGRATFAAPVAGQWNQVDLPSQVAVTSGQTVVPSIVTHDHYCLSPDASVFPLTNGNLSAGSGAGRFTTTDAMPGSGGTSCYFVDLVFTTGASDVPGILSGPLGGVSATLTGVRDAPGLLAANLPGPSALIVGGREVLAAMAASLAGVTARINAAGTIIPRPSIGTIARPDDGLTHVPSRTYP